MRRRSAMAGAQAARAVRGLWPDRNPLRRGLDRAEAAIVAVLAVGFLAGAPIAALTVWHTAYHAATRAADSQRSWHRAPAVLLASAPVAWDSKYGPTVRVKWAGPDGTQRRGTVSVPWGAKAGSTVPVWIDASGRLSKLPLRFSQVRGLAVLAAVLGAAGLGLLLACAGLLAHGALGWRRLTAWDIDWRATEPRWTRRH